MDDNWWVDQAARAECSVDWLKEKTEQLAVAVNGGNWASDYTEAQRRGWALTVVQVLEWGEGWLYTDPEA